MKVYLCNGEEETAENLTKSLVTACEKEPPSCTELNFQSELQIGRIKSDRTFQVCYATSTLRERPGSRNLPWSNTVGENWHLVIWALFSNSERYKYKFGWDSTGRHLHLRRHLEWRRTTSYTLRCPSTILLHVSLLKNHSARVRKWGKLGKLLNVCWFIITI